MGKLNPPLFNPPQIPLGAFNSPMGKLNFIFYFSIPTCSYPFNSPMGKLNEIYTTQRYKSFLPFNSPMGKLNLEFVELKDIELKDFQFPYG